MPKSRRPFTSPVSRLLPYTFLCTIGPSVTAATALFIVRTLMCRYDQARNGQDPPSPGDEVCNSPTVGALTASVMAALATLDGICSFLSSSYVQTLADKHGRRPLLIVLPILATLATSSMIVAYIVPNTRLAWILLVLNGTFVSASTKSVFVPTLCVADVASDKQRTRFYSLLEAVSLLGPGFAYIISALSSRYIPIVLLPYYIALGAQFISSLYAIIFVPETLKKSSKADEEESEDEEEESDNEDETMVEALMDHVVEPVVDAVVEPIKPLALLLPHRGKNGSLEWRLFILTMSLLATTSGTVFIATASLLFLSDKFQFNPEANAWVLAFLTFSRFIYLIVLFPLVQRFGRIAYNRYAARKIKDRRGERAPLLSSNSFKAKKENEEANHFDVILLFFSVCFDAVALMLVSTSVTWKHALVGFGILAFGAGDNPTYKSVFVSSVPKDHASQALAALDMVFNAARLLSPLLLGSIYAIFAERGQPELLFLVAGGLCAVGAALLAPLVFLGRNASRL